MVDIRKSVRLPLSMTQREWPTILQGERGVIIRLIEDAYKYTSGDPVASRHQLLAYLFAEDLGKPRARAISTKELTNVMWFALFMWVRPMKDMDKWISGNLCFYDETNELLHETLARIKKLDSAVPMGDDDAIGT